MRKVFGLLIAVLVGAVILSVKFPSVEYLARDLAGQEKREIFELAMAKADSQQVKTKQEFKDALEALRASVGTADVKSPDSKDSNDKPDPKSAVELYYEKVSSEFQQSELAVKDFKSRISELDEQSNALFTEWESEANSFSAGSEIKNRSLRDLREAKVKYTKVFKKLQSSLEKSEKTLETFRSYTLAIKHRLNAQTIDDVGKEYSQLSSDIQVLIDEMDQSIKSTQEYLNNK